MIDRTVLESKFNASANAVSEKTNEFSFEFEELLTEKTSSDRSNQEELRGLLSERLGIADDAFLEEITENIMKAVASMREGEKNIWDIVLRLEKNADIKLSDENIGADVDDTAGMNVIAGLLARFWKKKELLDEIGVPELEEWLPDHSFVPEAGETERLSAAVSEKQPAEEDMAFSGYSDLNDIDYNAASELAALTLKKKQRKLIAEGS